MRDYCSTVPVLCPVTKLSRQPNHLDPNALLFEMSGAFVQELENPIPGEPPSSSKSRWGDS